MAASNLTASPGDRVPAWKKIGLRLKNASETVPEVKATLTKQRNGLSQNDLNHTQHIESPQHTSTALTIRSPEPKSKSRDSSKKSKKRKASEANDAAAIVSSEVLDNASPEVNADQSKE